MENKIAMLLKEKEILEKKNKELQKIKELKKKEKKLLQKQLAEYQRKYGTLEGTTPSSKPTPPGKVRTRNSAKAKATAN